MTDRPDLQRLLEDIRARKIDVIVVYKADRLTRSLADLAKLVELFATRSQHRSGKGSRIPIAQESELRAGLKREVRPGLEQSLHQAGANRFFTNRGTGGPFAKTGTILNATGPGF